MNRYRLPQGDPYRRTVTLRDEAGRGIVGVYTGDEPLEAELLVGDDRPVAAVPDAAWLDPEGTDPAFGAEQGAKVSVGLDAAATAVLPRGVYLARLLLLDGDDRLPCWKESVEVVAGPGSAAAGPAYGTYDGVLRRAGAWLTRLADDAGQAGFAEELHAAWEWTHRQAMARAEAHLLAHDRGYLGALAAGPLLDATAAAAGATEAARHLARLAIVRTAIEEDDGLVPSATVVEANEHYAAAIVLERAMPAKDDRDAFAARAGWHRGRANLLLNAEPLALDLDGDGTAEVILHP